MQSSEETQNFTYGFAMSAPIHPDRQGLPLTEREKQLQRLWHLFSNSLTTTFPVAVGFSASSLFVLESLDAFTKDAEGLALLSTTVFGITFFILTMGFLALYLGKAIKAKIIQGHNPSRPINWCTDVIEIIFSTATLAALGVVGTVEGTILSSILKENMSLIEKFALILLTNSTMAAPGRFSISFVQTLYTLVHTLHFKHRCAETGRSVHKKREYIMMTVKAGLKHAFKLSALYIPVDITAASISYELAKLDWGPIFIDPTWEVVMEAIVTGAVNTLSYELVQRFYMAIFYPGLKWLAQQGRHYALRGWEYLQDGWCYYGLPFAQSIEAGEQRSLI